MRTAKNPYKVQSSKLDPPASITVGVLAHIPHQAGYYERSLDALRLCLASLRAHADLPF
jgi:hypothetical protein